MKPSELKALQREWAAKLKAAGFTDIEVGNGELLANGGGSLNHGLAEETAGAVRAEQLSAIEDAAQELLRRKQWPTPFHKRVWELHCEGVGVNRIRDILRCRRQRVLDAYLWCCETANIPTGAYGGVGESRHGDRRDRGDRRPVLRRRDKFLATVKCMGLRELLTIAAAEVSA